MKKILFGLILVLSSICAKAQIVADLNSISILGKWNVVDIIGSERSFFNRFGSYVTYTIPKSLDFFSPNSASTAQCRVCFADFSNETSESTYPGYWIEGALLGDNVFILHIWNPSSQEMINLKVDSFNGEEMVLSTYDGENTMYLVKDTSTGVNDVEAERTKTDGKMYSVDGVELDKPVKGITIKNGKKFLSK